VIRGTVRALSTEDQYLAEERIKHISIGTALTFCTKAEVDYQRRYPATINHTKQADIAIKVAQKIVGNDKVIIDSPPTMGSEDFAFMLQKVPGVYIKIGAGKGTNVHNPSYNFNDEILTTGVEYFVEIVNQELGN